ncbi:MAG: UDP-N-acetylglucosamine 2-epimerase [Bacillota bacterium]|jgi:UDP-N-acetylglucosamine 2-epimerase (non-hydrolysing)
MKRKIITVIGTRPEGIKMAPIIAKLRDHPEFTHLLISTGQHSEMLEQVLNIFQLQPDYKLQVMSKKQSISLLTSKIIRKLFNIFNQEQPALVLVHGDTTTTFSAAYAAFLAQIPVAHIEAGLRSYNKYAPFPEELNRQLVTHLATYHFAPTQENQNNLLRENIPPTQIFKVGNTVIDALNQTLQLSCPFPPYLAKLLTAPYQTMLVTTHRRENAQFLAHIYQALNFALNTFPKLQIIFPVHKNPVVKESLKYLNPSPRLHLIEPLDYLLFCHLFKQAHLILTDSGGIQEEACALGIPLLLAREETERPEGIQHGNVLLVGHRTAKIQTALQNVLTNSKVYNQMARPSKVYGDGQSSNRILRIIKKILL